MERHQLPADLAVPVDDGAADGLEGRPLPAVQLPSTVGLDIELAEVGAGTLVLYVYPRAGEPGEETPREWDEIPGARGCTPENCAFRDHAHELAELGAMVHGLSAQPLEEQRRFAERERIPYPLLNDSDLVLARELGLPTFEFRGSTYYRRLTLIARAGHIEQTFYPVFPPDKHPAEVVAWLRSKH